MAKISTRYEGWRQTNKKGDWEMLVDEEYVDVVGDDYDDVLKRAVECFYFNGDEDKIDQLRLIRITEETINVDKDQIKKLLKQIEKENK